MPEFLIIKPSSLGDIIHGLQVVQTLREQIEGLRIAWVVRERFAPFVASCRTVDKIYHFYRRGGIKDFCRLVRDLRKTRFDAVLDMQGLARSGLMTLCARAPLKLGRRDAREGASLFYTDRISLPLGGSHAHALERLLQFCPPFGLKPHLKGKLHFRDPHSSNLPEALLKTQPLVLFPNSRRPEKEWPYFAHLTERLLDTLPNYKVVWAGDTPLPAPDCLPNNRFYNLMGQIGLEELPKLVGAATLVISNDSAPMHLAAAMGTPVLAIFGPTPATSYGPYPLDKPEHLVLDAPQQNLALLKADDILTALRSMLEQLETKSLTG